MASSDHVALTLLPWPWWRQIARAPPPGVAALRSARGAARGTSRFSPAHPPRIFERARRKRWPTRSSSGQRPISCGASAEYPPAARGDCRSAASCSGSRGAVDALERAGGGDRRIARRVAVRACGRGAACRRSRCARRRRGQRTGARRRFRRAPRRARRAAARRSACSAAASTSSIRRSTRRSRGEMRRRGALVERAGARDAAACRISSRCATGSSAACRARSWSSRRARRAAR